MNTLQTYKFTNLQVLLILLLVAFGCKKKPEPEAPVEQPRWEVSSAADRSHSMTLVMALPDSLASNTNLENDEVGVFSDSYCLGACHLTSSPVGVRAMLVIAGPARQMNHQLRVRYYSANQKRIYTTTQPLPYVTDNRTGSVDNPFYFTWQPEHQ